MKNFTYTALKTIKNKGSKAIILENRDVLDYTLITNFHYDYSLKDLQVIVDDALIKLTGPYLTTPTDHDGHIKYYYAELESKGLDYMEKYERERTSSITIPIVSLAFSFIALIMSILALFVY